jgi:hypothetical protein
MKERVNRLTWRRRGQKCSEYESERLEKEGVDGAETFLENKRPGD